MRAAVLGLLTISVAFLASAASAEPRGARLALVIGEAAYPQARLPTADADAGLVASALAQAGFNVTALADADAAAVRAAVGTFAATVRTAGADAAVAVYVSGYGLQYRGENWLVPVGARVERDDAVPAAAVRLAELTAPLQAIPAALRLFVFDLARATPFAREGLPLARGLALTEAPVGSLYAFNAAPGAPGVSDVPPYGAYARALVEALQTPGLSPGAMLRRVRLRVAERTDGAVLPYDDGSSEPGFAFFPGPAGTASTLAAPGEPTAAAAFSVAVARDTLPGYAEWLAAWPRDPLAGRVLAMAATRREALIWSEAVRANTPRAYWTYQRRYPRGPHGGDVRRQLYALHAALEPPPRFEIVAFEGLPPPPPSELAALGRADPTFADADGPSIPTPPPALVPGARSAFFDTLAPPPIPLAGTLPLPLPVALAGGEAPAFGRVAQAAAAGPVVTSFRAGRDGPELVASGAKDVPLFRVAGTVEQGRRTVSQVAANGAVISRVAFGVGADGALAVTRFGPGGLVLDRWDSRDGKDGSRVTTMTDGAGQPVAITTVGQGEIVSAVRIQALPARFVLAPQPDGKGDPVVLSAPEPLANPSGASRPEAVAGVVEPPSAKAPALPTASGLTGEVPKLDLPPAPPTPAFDAAAAPVASPAEPGPKPIEPFAPSSATPAATPAPAAPAASTKDKVATPGTNSPPSSAGEAAAARPSQTDKNTLPSDPPLPPKRHAEEPKTRPRGAR